MPRPVAIFRHYHTEGPAFLGEFLTEQGCSWQLVALDEGAPIPASAEGYAGLAFMGGPMSVNDDLPWIPPVLHLIRDAVARGVPLLGHCLGSQLMSKALGGTVTRNPVKEIGWGPVYVQDTPLARRWFGPVPAFEAFHWHGETWSLPPGAELLAGNEACPHQAFALGPHLGLQFHVEMTEAYVRSWCEGGRREIESSQGLAVQPVATILGQMPKKLPAMTDRARHVYRVWMQGFAR